METNGIRGGGITGVGDAGLDGATTGAADEPGLLPTANALAASGDAGAMLEALVVKTASSQRKMARELKTSEEVMLRGAEDKEVSEIHKQGDLALAKGITSGTIEIAKGVTALIGCAPEGSAQPGKGAAAADPFFDGSMKIEEGAFDKAMKDREADAKAAEHLGDHLRHAIDDAKSSSDEAKELMSKALDFYQQWVQGKSSAINAALHRS